MTEKIWEKAFSIIIENEGEYTNDVRDKGNWGSGYLGGTKYGISKKQYPHLDIPNLSLDQAKEIYYRDYWTRYKCGHIPDALSVALFDSVVNSGASRMIKFLQEALGIKADGIIGNETIGACNRLPTKKVLNDFLDKRLNYLMSLKDWVHFGKGWGARINRVRQYCEELV